MTRGFNCLLAIDVWEPAYYLDDKNERPRYLEDRADTPLELGLCGGNPGKGGPRGSRGHGVATYILGSMHETLDADVSGN